MSYNEEYKSILSFPTTDGEYVKVGKYVGISNGWFRKTENPIYIFREMVGEYRLYEVISLFFADDHVVLEHHEIGKAHLEKSNDYGYLENIELDDMVDALNDGLGDRLYINSFHKSECEDVNTFINGLGIFATLKEEDFEYM